MQKYLHQLPMGSTDEYDKNNGSHFQDLLMGTPIDSTAEVQFERDIQESQRTCMLDR